MKRKDSGPVKSTTKKKKGSEGTLKESKTSTNKKRAQISPQNNIPKRRVSPRVKEVEKKKGSGPVKSTTKEKKGSEGTLKDEESKTSSNKKRAWISPQNNILKKRGKLSFDVPKEWGSEYCKKVVSRSRPRQNGRLITSQFGEILNVGKSSTTVGMSTAIVYICVMEATLKKIRADGDVDISNFISDHFETCRPCSYCSHFAQDPCTHKILKLLTNVDGNK